MQKTLQTHYFMGGYFFRVCVNSIKNQKFIVLLPKEQSALILKS